MSAGRALLSLQVLRRSRIRVTAVQIAREQQDGENVLAIRIRYNVISTNVPGNNVILSGIEQTVVL